MATPRPAYRPQQNGLHQLQPVKSVYHTKNGQWNCVITSYSIHYTKLYDNFNLEKLVEGAGAASSMLDLFTLNADGYAPSNLDPYYEQLAAYDDATDIGTDLIYSDENNVYAHDIQINPFV